MSTYIYVIAARLEGPVKIGFSANPERRLRQLQTGHAEALILHHTQAFEPKRAKLIERIIHKTIKHLRCHGEWFNIDVRTAIAEVTFALIRYEDDPNPRY